MFAYMVVIAIAIDVFNFNGFRIHRTVKVETQAIGVHTFQIMTGMTLGN